MNQTFEFVQKLYFKGKEINLLVSDCMTDIIGCLKLK